MKDQKVIKKEVIVKRKWFFKKKYISIKTIPILWLPIKKNKNCTYSKNRWNQFWTSDTSNRTSHKKSNSKKNSKAHQQSRLPEDIWGLFEIPQNVKKSVKLTKKLKKILKVIRLNGIILTWRYWSNTWYEKHFPKRKWQSYFKILY